MAEIAHRPMPDDPDRTKELRESCQVKFLPTPQQIDDGCEAIRKAWSKSERAKRRCGETLVRWELPTVEMFPCDRDVEE